MKRVICFIIPLVIILMALTYCCRYKSFQDNIPCYQHNTEWISENKQITFWVDENGHVTGTIDNGDDKIKVYFGMGITTDIDIYLTRSYKQEVDGSYTFVYGPSIEHWQCDFDHYDHFTATVYRTTYFHVGDKITFHRVDGS